MKKQIITTGAAPRSLLFSQGVRVGSTIYVSGMAGIDPAANKMAGATTEEQTKLGVELPNVLVSIMMTAHVEG